MEFRDFIITPIVVSLVYLFAFFLRSRVTDDVIRVYYFPALSLKIFGALALGFLYQFYYGGGDTYNYHTYGSRIIWEAFMKEPTVGFKLLFSDGSYLSGTYQYASRILFFHDPSSYFFVKVIALLDIFTFSTYSATAVLLSVVSFVGMWLLFKTFYDQFPHLHRWLAVSAFFIPSVFFWGSGLLKDTLTLSCLGMATYLIYRVFILHRFKFKSILFLVVSLVVIFSIKKYILLCFLPAALLWIGSGYLNQIRSVVLRLILVPFVMTITIFSAYVAVTEISENDSKYSLDNIAQTAKVTAYDIGFYSGRDAGSGYSLGALDGTFSGMIKLAPQAINVSLFRPYIWEVRNPLMLLSAIESLFLLFLTLMIFWRRGLSLFLALRDPNIIFCTVFSLTFAFAVGVSTFNFGTLSRYKIPLLPFYVLSLILIFHYSKNQRAKV